MKARKCYLGNKEQRAIFLVVSWSDVHVGIVAQFFRMSDMVRK